MQPKFFTEKKVRKEIVHCAGEFDQRREVATSLVIKRQNPSLCGRETLLSSLLLQGIVPAALLDSHKFWQGEDSVIRGTARDSRDEWFDYKVEIIMSFDEAAGWVATIVRKDLSDFHKIDSPEAFRTPQLVRRDTSSPLTLSRQGTTSLSRTASTTLKLQRNPSLARTPSTADRVEPLVEQGYPLEAAEYALATFRRPDGTDNYGA